ncbi:MAG: glutamine--tRNA ligase/YqeY domain fusion protein [Actinomycetota bacterium]|nr:glutamine--tRNA ligase/YqeY domain fusion protein [Actinomycetota bacterium]
MDDIKEKTDFIRDIIKQDLQKEAGKKIHTRFPPEPNGYLHIGHAKSICLNFGLAEEFNGRCNLRFDDTNPTKEESEYVKSIKTDIKWLGFDWGNNEYYASDYFEKLYELAVLLIKKGKAFVCDLSAEEIRNYRGTLTKPGRESPYRNRTIEENLQLFKEMRDGKYPNEAKVLRAKIDMSSPNINMRDPVMYRILHKKHHRTGNKWCIYPTYDWAHGQSDSIEDITYSICTLEFEDHRPLYDWFIEQLGIPHPRQIEFARLNLTHTVMSKRMLLELVEKKYVNGWDDPRMPTISGMRRRGYSPEAIRNFCSQIGVSKADSTVDMAFLEHIIREDLNKKAPRVMGVLNPVKVIIDNYPQDKEEELEAINNPEDPCSGTRKIPFSKILYIEKEDFMENPPSKFFRLTLGREVRLRYAYFIKCVDVIKDKNGEISEIHCTYDPLTKGGDAPDGRKVKSTLHWVSAKHCIQTEARLYDKLFMKENPLKTEGSRDFKNNLNPQSLIIVNDCKLEPSLKTAKAGNIYQFERLGYFCVDCDSNDKKIIFNRTARLKDEWVKIKASIKK